MRYSKNHEDTLTSIVVACDGDLRSQPGAGPYWSDLITLQHAEFNYNRYMEIGRGDGVI